ncbi:Serpin B10 [Sarcoptes scabiei]|uniref:Serpin domain-containing protein n=2 Tax=Sarcoptes scabiei TaxID=52283 RepID=A0A834R988_SARSC|nr:Serpin B10 [Sarcoptes scabiei]
MKSSTKFSKEFLILFLMMWLWLHSMISIVFVSNQTIISYGMRRLASSLNQFGFDSFRYLSNASETDNFAICPFCIGSSLTMLMIGLINNLTDSEQNDAIYLDRSDYRTLFDSLRSVLYLSTMQPQEINLAFLDLMRHLNVNLPKQSNIPIVFDLYRENRKRNDRTVLVNQVYIQRYLPINFRYHSLIRKFYRTPVRRLDFTYGVAEESRQHINALVEHITAGNIKNLIESEFSEPTSIQLLFISGLFFKGQLDFRQFDSRSKNRRSIFTRYWQIRSPFFATNKNPFQFVPMDPNRFQSMSKPIHAPFKPWLVNKLPLLSHGQTITSDTATISEELSSDSNRTSSQTAPIESNSSIVDKDSIDSSLHKDFDPFKPLELSGTKTKQSIRLRYKWSSYLQAKILEMPFTENFLSMLVLLPDRSDSLSTIISKLNAQIITDLMHDLKIHNFEIEMPPINLTFSISDLRKFFDGIGISKTFDPFVREKFAGTDLIDIVDVVRIFHKTVLIIDSLEEKTDRSDVSKRSTINDEKNQDDDVFSESIHQESLSNPIGSKAQNMRNEKVIESERLDLVDRHFLFLIIDNISGLILALGKI